MGMKKNNEIDRWIDLSNLPRSKSGNIIRWSDAVGYKMNFIYGEYSGDVTILEKMPNGKYKVLISIETTQLEYIMNQCDIRACRFGKALTKPIKITHPELVKYFVNKNDADIYSAHSNIIGEFRCPFCGTIIKKPIYVLTSCGLACPMCSDGISFPNKLMFNILKQLGAYFKNEVTKSTPGFDWITGKYRYDFYFEYKNIKKFIEMDGGFHVADGFKTYQEIREIDNMKDALAVEHGIQVIRIDCAYSKIQERFEYIKNKILNSDLNLIFDLNQINWDIANNFAIDSNIRLAAELWNNEDCCTIDIGNKLGVSRDTARGYLKIAADLQLCDYNDRTIEARMMRRIVKNNKNKMKPVALYKNGCLLNVFSGVTDLDRQSKTLYGVHMDFRNVYAVCRGDRQQAYGYTMKYITKDEYKQYSQQLNMCTTIQN